MDARRQQTDFVTGKTFTTSASVGSYSQSQIIPYGQPRLDFGSNYGSNSGNIGQTKVTKSKSASSWNLDDPEVKRRRRVASYKVYTVEGRMKLSLCKSVRWFKNKYFEMRYGWW
ncbi:hypothetical protein L7F22_013259 [Adiantum nelumboides]|nr:hypothetical protein [Adiantum nelumboides]